MEFDSIKRNHTDTIVELLSEKYLYNQTAFSTKFHRKAWSLQELYLRIIRLRIRYSKNYYINNSLTSIMKTMADDIDFTYTLWDYYSNHFPTKDVLKFGIKKEMEMKILSDLIRNLDVSNKSQVMAFHNDNIDEIYKKGIVLVSNFTLHRRSKLIYDFRSTSTLYYEIVLPFHDKNYDGNSADCSNFWELPSFS